MSTAAFVDMTEISRYQPQLLDLMAQSYENPELQLAPALARSTRAVLVQTDAKVSSFAFVADERLTIAGVEVPTVYLGQVFVDQQLRGRGVLKAMLTCVERQLRAEHGGKLPFLWGRTAIPCIPRLFEKVFAVNPTPSGAMTSDVRPVLDALRARFMLPMSNDTPESWVVRGVVQGRYRAGHGQDRMSTQHEPWAPLFAGLDIAEQRGDRLLLIFGERAQRVGSNEHA